MTEEKLQKALELKKRIADLKSETNLLPGYEFECVTIQAVNRERHQRTYIPVNELHAINDIARKYMNEFSAETEKLIEKLEAEFAAL